MQKDWNRYGFESAMDVSKNLDKDGPNTIAPSIREFNNWFGDDYRFDSQEYQEFKKGWESFFKVKSETTLTTCKIKAKDLKVGDIIIHHDIIHNVDWHHRVVLCNVGESKVEVSYILRRNAMISKTVDFGLDESVWVLE